MRAHRVFLIMVIVGLFLSCGLFNRSNQRGEVTGIRSQKIKLERPFGMTYIKGGSFNIGTADYGMIELGDFNPRTVSVSSFFIDQTEITNGQYMQFVRWVRDSVARDMLARQVQELGADSQSDGIGQFAYQNFSDTESLTEYQQYMIEQYGQDFPGSSQINWDAPLTWDFNAYPDQYYAQVMDSFYIHPSKWIKGVPKLDVKKFKYRYISSQQDQPSVDTNVPNSFLNYEPFISEKVIEIYPDTTVWVKDFFYSYNDPMHNNYFWHPAYTDYPVVGVNWHQANAFCIWRTQIKNSYNLSRGELTVPQFRLPTEVEWEFAARGGSQNGIYPWGSNELTNRRNQFLANFKPDRGDYKADQVLYTAPVKSYLPNGYNLYNMAGNVAEWTSTPYVWNNAEYIPSLNPNINEMKDDRKVIKGGSWKDVGYYLRISSRDFEYAQSARSFIGFRTVQDVPQNEPF
ncbi:MAG: gliding motility lipoprotein GldK [Flavobacteriaceae bacterium]|nr:gliding motility lipoprotein GldK [Flavobacteriaceae bacterium]MCY4267412.1 gliding motility lipoprotein GldK [Flavobacteriaceae bacterium]MCY4298674.1 gliding motility lipoprotein GldK [Flavobacteriaceae bacterium]